MPIIRKVKKNKGLSAVYLIAGTLTLWATTSTSILLATKPATAHTQIQPTRTDSFYGAYLAGSYAANTGSPYSSAYFLRALQIRPHNTIVQQELLFSFIQNDDFASAVRTAYALRNDTDPEIKPIINLLLAADAFRKHNYSQITQLSSSIKDQDETLLWAFLNAWSDFGKGQKKKALTTLENAHFSEWHTFLSVYNTALMQDLSNNKKQATEAYHKALDYSQVVQIAPESYEHLLIAYISFISRTNGNKAALQQLQHWQDELGVKSSVFTHLREQLEKGHHLRSLVNSPAEGAAEFSYDVGSTLLRAGEGIYANIYLQTALYLQPKNDAILFQLGVLATQTQQTAKANKFFSQISRNSPYYSDGELLKALSINQNLVDNDKTDKSYNMQAINELKKMIAKSPKSLQLKNILANSYIQTKNYTASIALLNKIIADLPHQTKENWDLYFQRGIAYERSKNWAKAETDFKAALKLAPKNADVLNYYGYSLVDRNQDLNKALEMLRQANALQANNAAILDSLGWAYYKLGMYKKAVPYLEKAVHLEPGDSSINNHLGDAYWRAGKKRNAVFQWNHALVFKPEPDDKKEIENKLQKGLPDIPIAQKP